MKADDDYGAAGAASSPTLDERMRDDATLDERMRDDVSTSTPLTMDRLHMHDSEQNQMSEPGRSSVDSDPKKEPRRSMEARPSIANSIFIDAIEQLEMAESIGQAPNRDGPPLVHRSSSRKMKPNSSEPLPAATLAARNRRHSLFSSAEGDDSGPTVDHTLQRTWMRRLSAFCSRKSIFREFAFLVILGVLSALLALGIGLVLHRLRDVRHAAAILGAKARDALLPPADAGGVGSTLARIALALLPFAGFLLCELGYVTVALLACLPAPNGPGSRHASGSGIPELKAILSGYWLPRYLSGHAFVAKVVGLIAALASGLFIGREGPMVALSATVGALLMQLPAFGEDMEGNHQRKRALLGAACAAGVVATFGTPIGGVLFSVEVTATFYTVSNLWRAFVGAIACSLCFQAAHEYELIETVPTTDITYVPHLDGHYLTFALLGLLQGVLSALLVQLMSLIAKWLKRRGKLRPVKPRFVTAFTVCAVSAMCNFALPMGRSVPMDVLSDLFRDGHLPGQGDATSYFGEDGSWSICDAPLGGILSGVLGEKHLASGSELCSPTVGLSLFVTFKTLMLLFAIVLPVPSGVFMPIFVLGAATGRLYGALLRQMLGYDAHEVPDAVMAVVGAAALTAGTTSTLSTALITIELTMQQELHNPVLIGVTVSCGVASMLSKSIFDQILVLKGLPYMPHLSDNLKSERLYYMTAAHIMRPTEAVVAAAAAAARFSAPQPTVRRRSVDGRAELIGGALPDSNPYHPAGRSRPRRSKDGRTDRALAPLVATMSVREVLAACRRSADRNLALVESDESPNFFGTMTRAQLLEWFTIEREIGEEEAAAEAEDGGMAAPLDACASDSQHDGSIDYVAASSAQTIQAVWRRRKQARDDVSSPDNARHLFHIAAREARNSKSGGDRASDGGGTRSSRNRDHLFRRLESFNDTDPESPLPPKARAVEPKRSVLSTPALAAGASDGAVAQGGAGDGGGGGSDAPLMEPPAGIESWLGDIDRPFPWDEIEWNRCALQISSQTALDEIHNLFSFLNISQVGISMLCRPPLCLVLACMREAGSGVGAMGIGAAVHPLLLAHTLVSMCLESRRPFCRHGSLRVGGLRAL